MSRTKIHSLIVCILFAVAAVGCGGGDKPGSDEGDGKGGDGKEKVTIRVEGSDTMVNVAQAWAEEYGKTHPNVSIQVSGGGSGVGIANLINGVTDLANASRKMKDKELTRAEQNTGKKPKEFIVGLDALAVYLHKDNPMETIQRMSIKKITAAFHFVFVRAQKVSRFQAMGHYI